MIKDTQVEYLRESMDVFDDGGTVIRYEEILRYDREERRDNEGWDWRTFRFKINRFINDKSYYLLHKDPHWKIYYCAGRKMFDIERVEKSWVVGNDKRLRYVIPYEQYKGNPFLMDLVFKEMDTRIMRG